MSKKYYTPHFDNHNMVYTDFGERLAYFWNPNDGEWQLGSWTSQELLMMSLFLEVDEKWLRLRGVWKEKMK